MRGRMVAPSPLYGQLLALALLAAVRQTAGRSKGSQGSSAAPASSSGDGETGFKRSCADIVGAAAMHCPRTVAQSMSEAELQRLCDLKMVALSTYQVVKQMADDACWMGYLQVRDSKDCDGSNSADCTSTACQEIESLWGLSVTPPTPSEGATHAGQMCEYFPGDEVHAWEPDCAATSAFISAASTSAAGAPCEEGFQAVVDDMATVCSLVPSMNAWTTLRCVATDTATKSESASCSAVVAPTSAQSCTDLPQCEYLDPSTLRGVWEGWGCVAGTVEEAVCPAGCQGKIDHYCKMHAACCSLLQLRLLLLCRRHHHLLLSHSVFAAFTTSVDGFCPMCR